jgi:hypothetical protein
MEFRGGSSDRACMVKILPKSPFFAGVVLERKIPTANNPRCAPLTRTTGSTLKKFWDAKSLEIPKKSTSGQVRMLTPVKKGSPV